MDMGVKGRIDEKRCGSEIMSAMVWWAVQDAHIMALNEVPFEIIASTIYQHIPPLSVIGLNSQLAHGWLFSEPSFFGRLYNRVIFSEPEPCSAYPPQLLLLPARTPCEQSNNRRLE
jgi:hypothetical protein